MKTSDDALDRGEYGSGHDARAESDALFGDLLVGQSYGPESAECDKSPLRAQVRPAYVHRACSGVGIEFGEPRHTSGSLPVPPYAVPLRKVRG